MRLSTLSKRVVDPINVLKNGGYDGEFTVTISKKDFEYLKDDLKAFKMFDKDWKNVAETLDATTWVKIFEPGGSILRVVPDATLADDSILVGPTKENRT